MIAIKLIKITSSSECLEITRRDGSVVKIEMSGLAEDTIFRFAVENELGLPGSLHQVGNGAEPFAVPSTQISLQVDALVKSIKDHHRDAPVREIVQISNALCQTLGVEILPVTAWKIESIRSQARDLLSTWSGLPGGESLSLSLK